MFKLSKFTKWQLFSLDPRLSFWVKTENDCHFVNLLSFESSHFFLSLRKITWIKSQQPKTWDYTINNSRKISTEEMLWFACICKEHLLYELTCLAWYSGMILKMVIIPECYFRHNENEDSFFPLVILLSKIKLRDVLPR